MARKTATSAGTDPVVNEILNGFRRIMRALRVSAGETQSRFKISAAQLFVLHQMHEAGRPLSINELAALTMTDRSSVAEVVERLVEGGYATRGQAERDRRRAEIRITAAGARLARSAPPAPTERLLSGLRGLSAAEVEALSSSLARLQAEMGLAEEPATLLFEDQPARARRQLQKIRR